MSAPTGSRRVSDHVSLEHRGDGCAIMWIQREPVNSMDRSLWEGMLSALEACEQEPGTRALVIASGVKKDVFMAGNDLTELYAPLTTRERYKEFWVILTTFLSRLYTSPLVTATAARGFCPAGGTAVLLCSDVRVISDVTSCGLNEVALGIPVPKYWSALMARVVGEGPASDMCLSGTMAPAHRCLELGMAQAAVPCALVVAEAERRVRDLLRHPDQGRRATKHLMRADFGAAWRDFAEAEADFGWDQLSQPAAIASLRAVFERLGSGKKRKEQPRVEDDGAERARM